MILKPRSRRLAHIILVGGFLLLLCCFFALGFSQGGVVQASYGRTIRYVAAAMLLLCWVSIALSNVVIRLKKMGSLIPIVGGWLGAMGVSALPVDGMRHWFWVPLVLDIGCAPMVLALVVSWMRRRFCRNQ